MARKVKLRTPEVRNRNILGRIFYYLSLFSFIFVTIYILLFSGLLSMNNIDIEGTKNIDKNTMLSEIRSELEGNYLSLISKNNILFPFAAKLEKDLREKYKKIDSLEIKRKFPSTLLVYIKEKNPAFIISFGSRYFLIDETGQIFEEISQESADFQKENWAIFKDTSGKDLEISELALPPELVGFISKIRDQVRNNVDMEIERGIETPSLMSYDVRIRTTEGWMIYFDANGSLSKQIEALKTVLDNKIDKGSRPNLEYVDLRSDNKVYYKFKEGVEQEENNNGEDQKKSDEQPKEEKKESKKKKH